MNEHHLHYSMLIEWSEEDQAISASETASSGTTL
jgi:hypothetical protein